MNGLRVYIKPNGTELRSGPEVFYSRRGNGPFYRWLYEEKAAQWRVCAFGGDFTTQSIVAVGKAVRWRCKPGWGNLLE